MKAKVSYNQIRKKLHLTFTSVKYVSGKILHIDLMLNRNQTLFQKVNLCLMNIR